MDNIRDVVICKTEWKSPQIHRYAVALVLAARRLRAEQHTLHFNNDDVDAAFQPNDGTTVGAAFRMLLSAGVITPWRGTLEAHGIYGGMRRSTRPECNGHRNQLYQLISMDIADAWLRRHGERVPTGPQAEMAFMFPCAAPV
jgi:hypothetical protein